MLLNLLASTADKFRAVGIGEVAVYALLGFAVVFMGIAFLIFVVWAIGKILNFITNKAEKKTETTIETAVLPDVSEDEISEETVAVITAAIMAYYVKENKQCEFTVKRIKKI